MMRAGIWSGAEKRMPDWDGDGGLGGGGLGGGLGGGGLGGGGRLSGGGHGGSGGLGGGGELGGGGLGGGGFGGGRLGDGGRLGGGRLGGGSGLGGGGLGGGGGLVIELEIVDGTNTRDRRRTSETRDALRRARCGERNDRSIVGCGADPAQERDGTGNKWAQISS